jgi:hypothetical protein
MDEREYVQATKTRSASRSTHSEGATREYLLNGAPVYQCCGCYVQGESYYTYFTYDADTTNWVFLRRTHVQMTALMYTGGSSTPPQ